MQRMERRGLCRGWREEGCAEDGEKKMGQRRLERRGLREDGEKGVGQKVGGGGGGGGKEHYKLSGDW